jgi:hypothetical protein
MPPAERISDVFKSVGQPTITYVKRDSGKLESTLLSALSESGQLCLITGPSKTGKTTLYREVLKLKGKTPLVVPCDGKSTSDSIWRQALEAVDFDRIESTIQSSETTQEVEGEISGGVSWALLAKISAKLRGVISGTSTDQEARARVLAEPGPDLLIPILKSTNTVLVIEDFHYLDDNQKIILFQQWKRFIDNEVTVLVLGTTHRAIDIARSNRDLMGRIAQIDVGHWEKSDLEQICRQGFRHLGVDISRDQIEVIATEAVGLPIVVQQTCYALFSERNVEYTKRIPKKFYIEDEHIAKALHGVARIKYTQFDTYYDTLIRGPREKSRKYRTYELVLACFTLDPIKFSLTRRELDHRMTKLNLQTAEIPPAASLNSTLGALKMFQKRRDFQLLEWRPTEEVLYIIEPSFLFFVRWRKLKNVPSVQLDFFETLINDSFSNWSSAVLKNMAIQEKIIDHIVNTKNKI